MLQPGVRPAPPKQPAPPPPSMVKTKPRPEFRTWTGQALKLFRGADCPSLGCPAPALSWLHGDKVSLYPAAADQHDAALLSPPPACSQPGSQFHTSPPVLHGEAIPPSWPSPGRTTSIHRTTLSTSLVPTLHPGPARVTWRLCSSRASHATRNRLQPLKGGSVQAGLLLPRTPQQTSPWSACSAPRASLCRASSLPHYQGSGH